MAGLRKLVVSKTVLSFFIVLCVCAQNFYSQSAADFRTVEKDSLVTGLEAYRNQEWARASILLRDAITSGTGNSDSVWYMMIMSQIYAGYYDSALKDCAAFENLFPESPMRNGLLYQRGRVLHLLGRNSEAAGLLADFCIGNSDSPMYVSALFWLAECFFDECDFASAGSLYSMIVAEHSGDSKAAEATSRLEEIDRSERERKLLYLLKLTGEEYLALREDYDRISAKSGTGLDSGDIEFLKEILNAVKESNLGIDEAKLNRLNKKLNQF